MTLTERACALASTFASHAVSLIGVCGAVAFFAACAGRQGPDVELAKAVGGSDASEVGEAARLVALDTVGSQVRLARACLRAGARTPCERFIASMPAEQGARAHAFLALAFGDPNEGLVRVQTSADAPSVRRDLSLEIARYYRRGDTADALLRARAALKAADALDTANERTADRKLLSASLAIAGREFASALAVIGELTDGDLPLVAEQRDELIRLGTLLAERAADSQRDATDQARKMFAEMNKLSPDEAVGNTEQLTQRYPASSLLFIALGFARLKASDEPGAVVAFEKARELCPFDPEPDYQLAKLHERRARFARAVTFLDRALQVAPAWPKGLWLMADLAMQAREPEAASRALTRLKRLFPDDVMVDLGRARALLDRDEGLRAMAVLKEAVREHPTDLRPALALGRAALTLHGRAQSASERERLVGEAERALQAALGVSRDALEVQALGNALEKLKKP